MATPTEIISSLDDVAKRYVLATPLQKPTDAGIISYYAGQGHGGRFAVFARKNRAIFVITRNCYNSANVYRLSPLGLEVRAHLERTKP